MRSLFAEFENENALRTYPFASGCALAATDGSMIGTGVFVDAALYPVNASGTLCLTEVSDGVVSVSDDDGVVMRAEWSSGSDTLEFRDAKFGNHAGTLLAASPEALAAFVNRSGTRRFKRGSAAFAASCVYPVVDDGVTHLSVGGSDWLNGDVVFGNAPTDDVRVTVGTETLGGESVRTLRFDVIPAGADSRVDSIRQIICVVDGRTPFRIQRLAVGDGAPGDTVAVYLDNIERTDICGNAHRENALEMYDACDCGSGSDSPEPRPAIPEVYQIVAVDIPSSGTSAFNLAVPNMLGYVNPLSLTLTDGAIVPKREIDVEIGGDNLSKLLDETTSKGVVLQVPGLAVS